MLEKKEKPSGISRREFLMGTAATAAVAGIAGLKVTPTKAKLKTITGIGTLQVTGTATYTPFPPPLQYIEIFERIGTVTYTGIIEGSGTHESHAMRDTSLPPSAMFNPYSTIQMLEDAKVAGRKGSLVIMQKGTTIGDSKSPEGSRSVNNHWEIISGSHGLGSIRGRGITLGRSWLGGTYTTYWVELSFDASE